MSIIATTAEEDAENQHRREVAAIKPGDFLRVHVPDVLPDPTDPAFGSLRGETLLITEVGDGYLKWKVAAGVHHKLGDEGSIPLKYQMYFEIIRTGEPSTETTAAGGDSQSAE